MKFRLDHLTPGLLVACVACAAPRDDWDEHYARWEASLHEVTEPEEVPTIDEHSELSDLELAALAGNPGLRAAFDEWEAALQKVPQAGALPEPRLTFAAYVAEVETRGGPMESRIGLMQPLPAPGKLSAAAEAADRLARAAASRVEVRRLEVLERVRDAWYELVWLDRAIQVNQAHRALLTDWERVARGRFESGTGNHLDVIRAQVELGQLENRVQGLRDMRRPIAARLNAELGRAPAAPLPEPRGDLPLPPAPDEAALLAALAEHSPALVAMRHELEAAEQAVVLAEKAFWPDFSIGVDYTFIGDDGAPGFSGSGDDAIAVSLGLDLPIWRSAYRAGEREARARLAAAQRRLEERELELGAELERALYELRDARRRVDLFRNTLIPKGDESVASCDAGYRTGREGFLDLLDAERVLLEFQLQVARAEADGAQALARIERLVGAPTEGDATR